MVVLTPPRLEPRVVPQTITFNRDGAGTSNIAGNVDLADQTVIVSGNVYQTAYDR